MPVVPAGVERVFESLLALVAGLTRGLIPGFFVGSATETVEFLARSRQQDE